MKGHPQQGRFLSFLLLFMGAMLGVVVSDSLLMLFVFWELTSITSFLLIGFDHERAASRRAALQALVVTGGGGLLLLAGLIFIWDISGLTQLSMLVRGGDILRDSPFYLAALLLVLGGAFTKSAQFPFHFWLPNAMEAPTPVSAYLHSATMVKAGVYLLMRLNPVLGDTAAWQILLPFFGGLTMLTGALLAVRQTDLKLMLAYTTVSSLGLLVMLTGFGSDHAIEAAVLYLVAHSLFKGALFMVAGIIDHETGTRDVTKLRRPAQGHAHHLRRRTCRGHLHGGSAAIFRFPRQGRDLLRAGAWQSARGAVYRHRRSRQRADVRRRLCRGLETLPRQAGENPQTRA